MNNHGEFDISDDPQVTGTPTYSAVPGMLLVSLATAFAIGVYSKIIPINPVLSESAQITKPTVPAKSADRPQAKP